MKLQDLFDHLSAGELSQMYVGGGGDTETTPGINADNRHLIISHINLGLTELHKRFLLKERRTDVYLVPGLKSYTVEASDLLGIERVIGSDGVELPLNDEAATCGVLTTSYNTLYLNDAVTDTRLTVIYRGNHAQISKREAQKEPEKVEIDLPLSHLEPLLLYVASRAMNPIGAMDQSGFHDGNNYSAKFEQACKRLENLNFRIQRQHETTKFEARGFV